tara:strand:- start:297 stop:803 length:507 start_codon:yes stop_codon:yes gene_type:complete
MKRFIPLLLLLASPTSVLADVSIKHIASTSLKVDGAGVQSIRVPSSWSVSGNNMKVTTGEHFGKLIAPTATASALLDVGVMEVNTVGSAFSYSESWIGGDAPVAIGSGVDVSSGVVSDMPAFGNVTVSSGGVAGNLQGTVLSSGLATVQAGGAGTVGTAQISTEINVK